METEHIIPATLLRDFVHAGAAIFTLHSSVSGKRYTFKVSASEPSEQYPERCWFVSLLTGPDNTADYHYIGRIAKHRGGLEFRAKHPHPAADAFGWFHPRAVNGTLPATCGVTHAGRCARCARLLTVPESVATGFGPDCAAMLGIVIRAVG